MKHEGSGDFNHHRSRVRWHGLLHGQASARAEQPDAALEL